MSDYYCVKFNFNPYNGDAADLLAAFLADIRFEAFEEEPRGLRAYIQVKDFSEEELLETINDFPFSTIITWTCELIVQTDWNEEWEKNYFKPLVLADGKCVVHSTFHKDYPASQYEIIIDPKMAFGTGHHATTSMMVKHLFECDERDKKVLDMGTGTGILAILADMLGASDVTGIEIDPGAFQNAVENGKLNNSKSKFILGDASSLAEISDIDIFLANINRNIILADLDRYIKTLKKEGVLILSGFYEKDIPLLERALDANGMKIVKTTTERDGWASIKATF